MRPQFIKFHHLLIASMALFIFTMLAPAAHAATTRQVDPDNCAEITIYCTIQSAIDASSPGDTVQVVAGTFPENLTINKRIRLIGAGSGSDDTTNTVVVAASAGSPVVTISGTGTGALSRIELRNLRVTGGSNGVYLIGSGLSAFYTFDNFAAVNNTGSGININHTGNVSDVVVNNATLSNNDNSGFRIATAVATFDGLTMTNTIIEENGIHGLITGPSGSDGVTNITISDTQFIRNGVALPATSGGYGDLSFFQFNGNATLTNISITGSTDLNQGAAVALQLRGAGDCNPVTPALSAMGNVTINGLTITGQYRDNTLPYTWIGSGLMIACYNDLSNLSLNNVNLDLTPATAALTTLVFNLYLDNLPGTALNLGNMVLGGQATGDIVNISTGTADATGATFTGAADNYAIEDRVVHAIDISGTGLVTWVPDNVFVTPNSFAPPTTTTPQIQRAVDAVNVGGTVNVAPGTYVNEFTIEKDLTMVGHGASTVIQSPTTLTQSFTTPSVNKPIILVRNADDVTLTNFVVDGMGHGNANNRFMGVAYHNAGGEISDLTVTGIRDTPFSGSQHGLAIYAINQDSNARTLDVLDNTVTDFQKNGITLVGAGLTGLVDGNTVTGVGPTTTIAQNGIQFSFGATGTINGNTVSDMSYTPGPWVSSGILLSDVSVVVTDNLITNVQAAIYFSGGSGDVTGNTVTADATGVGTNEFYGVIAFNASALTLTDNSFTGDDSADSYAVTTYEGYNNVDVTYDITSNTFTGWNMGIGHFACSASCGTGEVVGYNVNYNRIAGNVSYGLYSNSDFEIDAENNWWGCNAGPNDVDGDCDVVDGDVDFDPWLTLTLSAADVQIEVGDSTTLTGSLTLNSDDVDTAALGFVPNGTPALFTASDGSVGGAQTTTSGLATDTFDSTGVPDQTLVDLCVIVDNQEVCLEMPVITGGFAGIYVVYIPIVVKAP